MIIKVEIGQVWKGTYSADRFTITSISGKEVRAKLNSSTIETIFGYIDDYGNKTWSDNFWTLETVAEDKTINTRVLANDGVAVNDHVCPTCHNNKCSLTEINCWLCGNPLLKVSRGKN